jgi:formate dehydrogenase subunit gamma
VADSDQIVPPGHILRYTFYERLIHWTAALSYIYLLLTGLAFWSPWLFWLAHMLGGGQISRILHPWVGLIFFIAVCFMYAVWRRDMHFTSDDREWGKSLGDYVRNEDEKMPPAGRYNAGQKGLFWSFIIAGFVLLASGLVLWFTESLPWSLRWLRYVAVLLHPIAALVTIANFMIHVYMSVFAERGALNSMIRGDVSLSFIRRFHPGWYREIVGSSDLRSRERGLGSSDLPR